MSDPAEKVSNPTEKITKQGQKVTELGEKVTERPQKVTELDEKSNGAEQKSNQVRLTAKQRKVLEFCDEMPRTAQEILDMVGVKYHTKTLDQYINKLVDADLLRPTGAKIHDSNRRYITAHPSTDRRAEMTESRQKNKIQIDNQNKNKPNLLTIKVVPDTNLGKIIMKKLFTLLLAMVLSVGTLFAKEYSGTCGENLHWVLDTNTGILTISGSGVMTDYVPIINPAPWNQYASLISHVRIQEGVTTIGDYAIDQLSNLLSISIPISITTISSNNFSGLTALDSIHWDNNNIRNQVFGSYREQISAVTFGVNMDTIPTSFCSGMNHITKIIIPDNVKFVGREAFSNCNSLTDIVIGKNVEDFGYNAFYKCKALENVFWNSTKYDDWNPFFYLSPTCCCGKGDCGTTIPIKTLIFGDDVENIPSDFCDGICYSLTSIILGKNIRIIGSNAFYMCCNIKELIIPDKVDSIHSDAFSGCSSLEKLYIGKNVSYISEAAFNGAEIKHLTWNAKYCKPIYSSSNYIMDWWEGEEIETIIIGEDVDTIPGNLCNLSKIEELVIPDNVKVIEREAFGSCYKLKKLKIGKQVERIDSLAISHCEALDSIIIPDNVRELGYDVFSRWYDTIDYIYVGKGLKNIKEKALTYNLCKTMHWNVPKCDENIKNWPRKCDSIVLGGAVREIPDEFIECQNKTLIIPDGITSVGAKAFSGGDSLENLIIGKGLKSVQWRSFNLSPKSTLTISWNTENSDWSNLPYYDSPWNDNIKSNTTAFNFGNTVKVIPPNLCYSFKRIKSITIPNCVEEISEGAFIDCDSLQFISMANSVSKLGKDAFAWCSNLKSVNLSKQLSEVPSGLFNGCISMQSIDIPDGVHKIGNSAFGVCSNMMKVTLPTSIDTIEGAAFWGCYSLMSLNVPDEVSYIGESAFSGVPNIQYNGSASWGWGSRYWGARSMNGYVDSLLVYSDSTKERLLACSPQVEGHLNIPQNVKYIGEFNTEVFSHCNKLISVGIPGSVEGTGNEIFYSCDSLKSVRFEEGVQSIGSYLFKACNSLEEVTLPRSLTEVGSNIFIGTSLYNDKKLWHDGVMYKDNWVITAINDSVPEKLYLQKGTIGVAEMALSLSKITSIHIPSSLKYFNSHFSSYENLKDIYVEDLSTWCNIDFQYGNPLSYAHDLYVSDTILTHLDIPEGVTQLHDYAFQGDTNIVSVVVPTTIDTCGYNVFDGCFNIEKIQWNAIHCKRDYWAHELFAPEKVKEFTFGKDVQLIPYGLCEGLACLDTIHLYDKVNVIQDRAFKDCYANFVICEATTPPAIVFDYYYDDPFSSCNEALYVPAESVNAYKNSEGWSNFYNIYPIGLVATNVDSTIVEVYDNYVQISWQSVQNARRYEISINKDSIIVYQLTFDSYGHLTDYKHSIPNRNRTSATKLESHGWQYTIEDLTPNTYYTYKIEAFTYNNSIIASYEGEFTTYPDATVDINNIQEDKKNSDKLLRDGQIFILRGDKTYTLQGQGVK